SGSGLLLLLDALSSVETAPSRRLRSSIYTASEMRTGLQTLVMAALAAVIAGSGGGAGGNATTPTGGGSAPTLTQKDFDAIREIGRKAVEEDGVVGISIAVSRNGETVFAEGFGHADVERTVPVNKDTIFDIASAGK